MCLSIMLEVIIEDAEKRRKLMHDSASRDAAAKHEIAHYSGSNVALEGWLDSLQTAGSLELDESRLLSSSILGLGAPSSGQSSTYLRFIVVDTVRLGNVERFVYAPILCAVFQGCACLKA